jgi:hypothetical protein
MKNEQSLPMATAENLKMFNELKQKYEELAALREKDFKTYAAKAQEALEAAQNYMYSYEWSDTVFEENGLKGVKNVFGEITVPALYDEIGEVLSCLCILPCVSVRKGEHWGLARRDGTGEAVLDCEYDNIFFEPRLYRYLVKKEGQYGVATVDGTLAIPCSFDAIYEPEFGMMRIGKEGKYGMITPEGLYVEPIYDEVLILYEEHCQVTLDGQIGWLDKEGHFTQDSEKAAIGVFNY